MSLTVGKDGNVKATGKLADGTKISATSPFVYEGLWRTYIYVAPSAYKGGSLALEIEFEVSDGGYGDLRRVLYSGAVTEWTSRNPQATGEYGEGFRRRNVWCFGTYYDKLDTLSNYYDSLRLMFDDIPSLGYTFKATFLGDDGRRVVETEAAEAEACNTFEQDGMTVSATDKGFAVAKATKPAKIDGEWVYEGANDGALSLSFAQATGLFKGSYTFWFDYPSAYDETADRETWSHASKKVSFEGIWVQGVEDLGGFYLWDATGVYEDPKTGKEKTYKYKASYPVMLLDPALFD